jgi:hypothetical protein
METSSLRLPAKNSYDFSLVFGVTSTDFAEAVQRDSAKFTARPSEGVGHVRYPKSMLRR